MRRLLLIAIMLSITLTGKLFANSDSDTDALIQQSYEQTKAGNLNDALKTLQQAVNKDPDSSLARTRLGGVRLLRKEYSDGIKDFQAAIMLDQKNASAFIGMAVAYLHMGQYSLARAALNEAGKVDPSKQLEIDQVLSWIDQRTSGNTVSAH